MAARSVLLWVGGLLFLVGAVFASIGLQTAWEQQAYETHGVTVTATVLEKSIRRANRQDTPRTQYLISYRFVAAEGDAITGAAEVPVEEWERLEAGRPFPVTYLAGNPASSRASSGDEWIVAIVFGIVGGVFTLVGGGLACHEVRSLARAGRLLRHGTLTDGTVVRTEPTGTRINRVTQWRIRYRYRDHLGRPQEGVSHLVPPEEAAAWKEGDPGSVRYDRERPEISLWMGTP